ncbi:TOMM precursor leader peptide-binding protein [Nesterenkonia suensis]
MYRLTPDATATVLDPTTVRLQSGAGSVLLDGDAEALLAATETLAAGVPIAVAPAIVEQLWRDGVLERDDGVPAAELRRVRLGLSSVLIDGLSDCGARLAELLVARSVGTLVLRDGTPVSEQDEGEHLRPLHRGRRRAAVLTDLLGDPAGSTSVVECPPEGAVQGADVQVLVRTGAAGWPDRGQLEACLGETAHVLPISLTGHGAQVGPMVAAAGPAPCPRCLHGYRHGGGGVPSHDGRASFRGVASEASGVDQPAPGPLVSGLCAHVAALQLEELLAGQRLPALMDAVLDIDAATGAISSHLVPPSADCGCRAQSELLGVSSAPSGPS